MLHERYRYVLVILVVVCTLTVLRWRSATVITRRRGDVAGGADGAPQLKPLFVVLFHGSSGSTWFMSNLEAGCGAGFVCFEPFCCKYKEKHDAHLLEAIFSVPREVGKPVSTVEFDAYQQRMRHALPDDKRPLFRDTVSSPAVLEAASAFGFKVRPAFAPSLNTTARAEVEKRGVRIISIVRENVVKTAVAEVRRLEKGLGQFKGSATVAQVAAEVDPAHLLAKTRVLQRKQNDIHSMRSSFSSSVATMNVTYEQLVSAPTAVTATACAFIGVPVDSDLVAQRTAHPKTAPATPDDLCMALPNYDEICRYFVAHADEEVVQWLRSPSDPGNCTCVGV
jgi:hypothetical protein